jgi:ABC-type multidrug transport system ATPase subunit
MNEPVTLEGLFFRYSFGKYLFEDINLSIPKGAVYGLLGPNGSGKSTLMKIMLGLKKPGKGKAWLFDESSRSGSRNRFSRVGALIEEPHLYHHLSARENLRVSTIYHQLPYSRMDEVLELTGLKDVGKKRVRHFSTGMKQRLAIAIALLPDPDLLILDEPTNGLDPQGIADVRALIQLLNQKYHKTILLSSHLLSEIEQSCSHLGILYDQKIRFEGTLEDLRDKWLHDFHIHIETGNTMAAWMELKEDFRVERKASFIRIALNDREEIPVLIDRLREKDIPVYQVKIEEARLEEQFFKVVEQDGKG